ncbi:DUF2165 family protein [Salmonella enterica]
MKIKFFSHPLNIGKLLYLYGFGMWMTIITFNNINDPETNMFYIKSMFEMSQFNSNESNIGQGLLWRAINYAWIDTFFIRFIIVVELIIDIFMWRAFFSLFNDVRKGIPATKKTIDKVNVALSWMIGLFSFLITGGIWFAYWIHMGAFQMVHLTAIILCVLGFIFFNMTDNKLSE